MCFSVQLNADRRVVETTGRRENPVASCVVSRAWNRGIRVAWPRPWPCPPMSTFFSENSSRVVSHKWHIFISGVNKCRRSHFRSTLNMRINPSTVAYNCTAILQRLTCEREIKRGFSACVLRQFSLGKKFNFYQKRSRLKVREMDDL